MGSPISPTSRGFLVLAAAGTVLDVLLPGASLDGGRMLYVALWCASGYARWAAATTERVRRVLTGLLCAAGILLMLTLGGLWLVMLGAFLAGMGAKGEESDAIR